MGSDATLDLPDQHLREIEKVLRIEPDSHDLRSRLVDLSEKYNHPMALISALPVVPHKELKDARTKLAKRATALADYLDIEGGAAYMQAFVVLEMFDERDLRHRRKQLVKILRLIASEIARRLPADKRGTKDDYIFSKLILELADLYRDLKRKEPGVSFSKGEYKGPFFRFVEKILLHVVPVQNRRGNLALGKEVQRVLRTNNQQIDL